MLSVELDPQSLQQCFFSVTEQFAYRKLRSEAAV